MCVSPSSRISCCHHSRSRRVASTCSPRTLSHVVSSRSPFIWHRSLRLNRIDRIPVPLKCIFLFWKFYLEITSRLDMLDMEFFLDGWPTKKFLGTHKCEQSAHKNVCCSMGIVYDPRELSWVTISGPGVAQVLRMVFLLFPLITWWRVSIFQLHRKPTMFQVSFN